MNQSEIQGVAKGLSELAMQYPRYELTDLPAVAVIAALDRVGKTSTFFPAVAEIRKEIGTYASEPEMIAETAWIEVKGQVRRCGLRRTQTFTNGRFYDSPEPRFSSEIIRKTVESVGWDVICTGNQDKVSEQFKWAYKAIQGQIVSRIQRGDISTGETLPANVSAIKEIAS